MFNHEASNIASTTSQPLASEFFNNLDEVIKLFYSKPSDGLAIEVI